MIKINFLAPEAVKKEERKEILIILYLLAGLIVIAGIVKYGIKYVAYKSVQNQIELTKSQLNKYESIVKQVDELRATKAVLESKKNVINSLMEVRLIYPKFMETLMSLSPDNLWFRTLNTKIASSTDLNLELSAVSLDNFSIAEFITNLSNHSQFSGVELGPIVMTKAEKNEISSFDMKFSFSGEKK